LPVAAVFDIDGTLVTFNFDVKGTRKVLLDELDSQGFDTSGLSLSSPTQQIIDSAEAQAASGRVAANFENLRRRVYSILDEFEMESVPSTAVLPGTREALDRLRSGGVRLAVLTNSGRKSALEVLRRAELLGYFEFILTRDDTEAMKPRPEGLAKAVALLRVDFGSAFYVGDSPYDIAAAKKAGLRVISVATGSYTAKGLRSEGADHVIQSMDELPQLLGV
jgi:HAD superfamily hydrolase (TIGR01509 family)